MLILTRKLGEAIIIGGDIRIRISHIRGTHVKLAISAPPSVCVDRLEVRRKRFPPAAYTPETSSVAS